jgi:hypothetical protein
VALSFSIFPPFRVSDSAVAKRQIAIKERSLISSTWDLKFGAVLHLRLPVALC